MIVNEIFRSIQGESSYVGLPCIFIRLTGCNLRCSYCDTKYAYKEGKKMSIARIAIKVKQLYKKGDIIEITGGEPMLQKKEVEELISKLHNKLNPPFRNDDITILIETNGAVILPEYFPGTFIMDWKLPSSGMNDKMEHINLARLQTYEELKFVIGDWNDYDEMKRIITKYKPDCKILVSTVWDTIKRNELVEKMLKDGIKARFQVQLHKIIWDKNKRGV